MRFRILFYCTLFIFPIQLYAQNVEFIENRGQWDGPFKYRASTGKGDVFLENNGFTYMLGDGANFTKIDDFEHGKLTTPPILKYYAYKMCFEGASTPTIVGSKKETGYYNYYLGNNSSKWKSGIHPYHDLDYKNLYRGVDMHVSSGKGNIEYEFVVQPGADANQIKLRYDGTEGLSIKKNNLIIHTSVGDAIELKPYAYQYINDVKAEVACNYALNGNTISYVLPDGYDKNHALIIDPVVIFATFTGSTADNWGFTATYDLQGNFYAGGIAHSLGYPVSTGAFQVGFAGGVGNSGIEFGSDIAVIKYDPTLSNRIYATYIGGALNERPHSMIVDSNNNLIIAGRSTSADYPVTSSAFQTTKSGGWDIIVTKLNSTGTALIGSTYLGGPGDDGVNYDSTEFFYGNLKHNYGDDARSEVQVDNSGNIYVTGCTRSSNFPTTVNAYQTTLNGTQDAVIFKMNSNLSALLYSTYLGGSSDDAGYVIAFDKSQASFLVAGGTQSSNFPSTTGTLHPAYQGGTADGFVVKFQNSTPYTLQKGTFIGTTDYDQVYGIQVDASNNVYVMGQSLGGLFPVTSGVFNNPESTQFLMKMDSSLATDVFSTIYGNGISTQTNISPVAFLVDTCENIFISGYGGNLHLNNVFGNTVPASLGECTNMPITPNAAQSTTDGFDFYFIVFSKNALALQYATYMGLPGVDEHVDGGTSRFDKNGIVYQAICGGCGGNGFPTTVGAWSMTNNSGNCNEVALKINFSLGPVVASATPSPSASGCAPLTVQFNNTSNNGATYNWDFGDGTPQSAVLAPSHTFATAGTYHVRLIANNANACSKTIDTGYVLITVDTGSIIPQFIYARQDSCGPYSAVFTNTSQHGTTATQYVWSFGDNTTYAGINPPLHMFPAAGTYTVTLTMSDSTACNGIDSVSQTLSFSNLRVSAGFTVNDTVCINTDAVFTNTSANGSIYTYYFGNDQSASGSATTTTHQFTDTGTYTVTLVVSNPGACNGLDSFTRTIVATKGPTADFSFTPTIPVTNMPLTFTNLSVGAVRYLWDFGDNSGSTDVNPSHLFKRTGQYNVCLTAYNRLGCPAQACRQASADIQPLADLPTGFSPNGDGANDILYVRGAAIQTLDLMIFNRWGQLVFETTDQNRGWDGTYNGKPQEMDAYAYVLKVTFIDGSTLQKKGNVTLLR